MIVKNTKQIKKSPRKLRKKHGKKIKPLSRTQKTNDRKYKLLLPTREQQDISS